MINIQYFKTILKHQNSVYPVLTMIKY